ncbi:MAG: rane fusion protein multidrug efflux system [Acidobacteriota bacterium]|nr:rane fusion protein multidrug efflux system [Acidobacteriota bacterium]
MDLSRCTALPALLLLWTACSPAPPVPEEAPPLPVKLARVERSAFQPTLALLGVMRASGEAEVIVPVAGRLRYPPRFRAGLASGVPVRAGEVLAQVANPEAEQELGEARLRLASAKTELDRYQRAFDSGVVPAAQLAHYKAEADLAVHRLEAARERQSNLDLRSPVAGRLLVERRLPPGGEVQPGTLLARVTGGGAAKVEAQAAAADRERLREGQSVRFAVPGRPETAGRGVIREISPVVGAGGTVSVVAEVTAGAILPPPGEGVEVQVELDPRFRSLTVPEEALVMSGGTGTGDVATVYVAQGGVAKHRQVTLGGRSGGRVEILTGLSPGDKVVVDGAALLVDDARVTAVEEPAPAQGTSASTPAGPGAGR